MWRADSLEKTQMPSDWGQKEKPVAENEMVRWHHWLNGQEFKQIPGDGEGQKPDVLQSLALPRARHDLATTTAATKEAREEAFCHKGALFPC